MVEYLIVLSIALSVALPLSKNLLIYLDGTIARMGATLEKKLYTGRVKVETWKN